MTASPDPAHALRGPTARVSGYELLERGVVVVLLLAYAGVHVPFLFGPWPERGAVDIHDPAIVGLLRLSWLPVYTLVLALALLRWRAILGLVFASPGLTLLILLCPLSMLWSIAPEDTARRSLALLITSLFGVYLAARFEPEKWLRLLALGLSAAVVISVATGMLAPEIGIMETIHPGAWRGVFPHKNTLGHMAVLTLMVLGVLTAAGAVSRRVGILGMGMAASALILSRSLTALVAVVAAALAATTVGALRARPSRAAAACMLVVVSLAVLLTTVLAVHYDLLLASVGRDHTLTGRTELWGEVFEVIERRPWLGYGYGAVWSLGGSLTTAVHQAVGWPAANAHNGYVDLWLQLGAVGLVLFTASMLSTLSALIRRLGARSEEMAVVWSASMLTFVLVYNLAESALLRQNDLIWIVFVGTVAVTVHVPNAPATKAFGLLRTSRRLMER